MQRHPRSCRNGRCWNTDICSNSSDLDRRCISPPCPTHRWNRFALYSPSQAGSLVAGLSCIPHRLLRLWQNGGLRKVPFACSTRDLAMLSALQTPASIPRTGSRMKQVGPLNISSLVASSVTILHETVLVLFDSWPSLRDIWVGCK